SSLLLGTKMASRRFRRMSWRHRRESAVCALGMFVVGRNPIALGIKFLQDNWRQPDSLPPNARPLDRLEPRIRRARIHTIHLGRCLVRQEHDPSPAHSGSHATTDVVAAYISQTAQEHDRAKTMSSDAKSPTPV